MNYKQLLLKYINHVGASEGATFLDDADRESYPDFPQFTDEEWAALQELDKINYKKDFVDHSCSCHVRNAGPCGICKELGCEVFNFNQVAASDICTGTKFCAATMHANDCPKWEE